MEEPTESELVLRVSRLERHLALLRSVTLATAIVAGGILYYAIHVQQAGKKLEEVLRVKGIIIEDATGRDRILIGAPVPDVNARKRHDNTVGLIVLGENGADRVAVGAPGPDPQIDGVIAKCIGKDTGLVFDDENGDERGGLGFIDNDGRAIFGLDYPHGRGEAITLGVLPGENSIAIHDDKGILRAAFLERGDLGTDNVWISLLSPAKAEMRILRLNPYEFKQVVIPASDNALNEALDEMSTR